MNQELKNCWGGEENSVDLALCSFHFTHNKHHALKKQKTVSHMENILQDLILFGLNFELETLDLLWMKNEHEYCKGISNTTFVHKSTNLKKEVIFISIIIIIII